MFSLVVVNMFRNNHPDYEIYPISYPQTVGEEGEHTKSRYTKEPVFVINISDSVSS